MNHVSSFFKVMDKLHLFSIRRAFPNVISTTEYLDFISDTSRKKKKLCKSLWRKVFDLPKFKCSRPSPLVQNLMVVFAAYIIPEISTRRAVRETDASTRSCFSRVLSRQTLILEGKPAISTQMFSLMRTNTPIQSLDTQKYFNIRRVF